MATFLGWTSYSMGVTSAAKSASSACGAIYVSSSASCDRRPGIPPFLGSDLAGRTSSSTQPEFGSCEDFTASLSDRARPDACQRVRRRRVPLVVRHQGSRVDNRRLNELVESRFPG